jgi:hypothetical protein
VHRPGEPHQLGPALDVAHVLEAALAALAAATSKAPG